MLRRAIERLLWVFPVYRTYGPDAPASDAAIRKIARKRVDPHLPPGEAFVVDQILDWLGGRWHRWAGTSKRGRPTVSGNFRHPSPPRRWRIPPFTAMHFAIAKRCRFRCGRLSLSIAAFHERMRGRAERFPLAMLTTATHDHKRGEDVRARLAVLSAMPEDWRRQVEAWRTQTLDLAEGIDPADWYMLIQTLVGAWPGPDNLGDFAERIAAWQEKALREAKLRSSWEAPDTIMRPAANRFAQVLIDGDEGAVFSRGYGRSTPPHGACRPRQFAGSGRAALYRPGVPDCYQGTEFCRSEPGSTPTIAVPSIMPRGSGLAEGRVSSRC